MTTKALSLAAYKLLDPNGVRESYARMFLTPGNVYRFHADYAELDSFDRVSEDDAPNMSDRPSIDRWILSQVSNMADKVDSFFRAWDFHKAEGNRTLHR